MIRGIGLDIIELSRIKEAMDRSEKFQNRILTKKELHVFNELSDSRKVEFLAGRFAAKEAFSKARGTGIRKDCTFGQIEILNDPLGKPILYFDGEEVNGFVSITHSREYAAAQVILLG